MNRISLSILALSLAGSATAQSVLYSTDFVGANDWTITTGCSNPAVRWRLGTYFPFTATPPSGSWSLHFVPDNFGTWPWGHLCGTASSPVIDLTGSIQPELSFRFLWVHEIDCAWDAFRVEVRKDATNALLYSDCLSYNGVGQGYWATQTIPLDPQWGAVRVVFSQDTLDEWNGWEIGSWVDDVEVVALDCGVSLECGGEMQTTGAPGARLVPHGTPSLSANDIEIAGEGFPLHTFASSFVGIAPAHIPIGSGVRCIQPGTSARFAVSPTRDTGRPYWTLDLFAPPLDAMALVGSPLYFQAIYRDGTSVNFSDALRFDICP